MIKAALIAGAVLLLAGVATAGSLTGVSSSDSPTVSTTTTTTDVRQEDRQADRQTETRGRDNEAGEDISGPCDEAEHASDPRCTGAAGAEDDGNDDDRGGDDRSGPSGHSGGDDGNSGHGGGNSGPGGGDDD